MMILRGIGDPSNGNGGYSYLKLPLKMSQDSLNNEVLVNKKVTGTEADLRKLSKEKIHEMLRSFGFEKQINIEKLSRWDGVKILRDHSSKAASLGVAGNFKKFARGGRLTSKMQRETYQDHIDEIFDKQLNCIAEEKPEIPSDSEVDNIDEEEKDIKSMMKDKDNSSRNALYDEDALQEMKTYLECSEDKDIKNIHELPGYNQDFREHLKEAYDKFKEGSHKCAVLKKVIRSIDPITKQEKTRVVYIFDERHIKSFKKRIEKCKTRRRTKPKTKDRNIYGPPRSRNEPGQVSFRLGNRSEDYDSSSYRSGPQTNNRGNTAVREQLRSRISIPLIDNGDEESKINGSDDDEDYGRIVLDTDSHTGNSKKRDGSKKVKKPKRKSSDENQYLNGPKRQNTCSRRRQNTPLSQFNEILTNIIDCCITYDNTRIFHMPVKKSEVPTYYDIIKNPMDLSTMKAKSKRCEYKTLDGFMADLSLLKTNSEAFNGPIHFVTTQAVNILERAEMLVQTDLDLLKALEIKIEEDGDI